MKTISIFLFLFSVFHIASAYAQDAYTAANHSKYKIGAKFIAERSGNFALTNSTRPVCSGGFQVIRQLKKSKLSIESGVYLNTKAIVGNEFIGPGHTVSRHISVPVNGRFDISVDYFSIYISGGPFIDYMVEEDRYQWNNYFLTRKLGAGCNINIGLERLITKSLSVLVEGRYAATLTPTYTNSINEIDLNYVNYGIAIGLNYKI